jgi:AcrR family transcriptional regulator
MPAKRGRQKRTYHHGDLAAALLEAAEAELIESGIEAFSLRSVAKRAGVSHGAPAHHFTDAKGLLTALAADGHRRLSAAQKERQETAAPDPVAQFVASGLGYIDFAEANPALFRLMFSSERPDRTDPFFAEASQATYADLVMGARSVVEDASPEAASHQLTASWALAHGLSDLLISGRLSGPLGEAAQKSKRRDEVFSGILMRALPADSSG